MKKRLMIICAVLFLSVGFACEDQSDEIQVEEIMTPASTGDDEHDEDEEEDAVPCGCSKVG